MRFIISFLKKSLVWLIVGATSFIIAACYGPPVGFDFLGHWTIRIRDGKSRPVKGIMIVIRDFLSNKPSPDLLGTFFTDSTGTIDAPLTTYDTKHHERFDAFVRDTDGPANLGNFRDTIINKGGPDTNIIILNPNTAAKNGL
jgi:hypothetical protein